VATLYATLGVGPEADARDVVRAYRRLVRIHHPDAGGDAVRFRAVQAAYEVLGNATRRAAYDAELARDARPTPAPPPPRTAPRAARRQPPVERTSLRRPSPARCLVAALGASAAVAVPLVASAATVVGAAERRTFFVTLVVAAIFAKAGRALVAADADRAMRHRMIWRWGFAPAGPGDVERVQLCERLVRATRGLAISAFSLVPILLVFVLTRAPA
jgi:hypothetical protein